MFIFHVFMQELTAYILDLTAVNTGASTTGEEDVAAATPLHGELLTAATPAPTRINAAIWWCYRVDQSW